MSERNGAGGPAGGGSVHVGRGVGADGSYTCNGGGRGSGPEDGGDGGVLSDSGSSFAGLDSCLGANAVEENHDLGREFGVDRADDNQKGNHGVRKTHFLVLHS